MQSWCRCQTYEHIQMTKCGSNFNIMKTNLIAHKTQELVVEKSNYQGTKRQLRSKKGYSWKAKLKEALKNEAFGLKKGNEKLEGANKITLNKTRSFSFTLVFTNNIQESCLLFSHLPNQNNITTPIPPKRFYV